MLAQYWSDGIRGFIGVIPRDGRNEMVEDVRLDNTVHEVTANDAKLTIDGRHSATSEVPRAGLIVGKSGIGMLEEGNPHYPYVSFSLRIAGRRLTKPVVDPEIWYDVADCEHESAKLHSHQGEANSECAQAQVAHDNQMAIFLVEYGAVWIEVIHAATKAILLADTSTVGGMLMLVVASDVRSDIQVPSDQLLTNEGQSSHNRRFFAQFGDIMDQLAKLGRIFFPSCGYEYLISFDVARRLVMLAMGYFPGEVGNAQC